MFYTKRFDDYKAQAARIGVFREAAGIYYGSYSPTSVIASCWMARFMQDLTGIEIMTDIRTLKPAPTVFIFNSPFLFAADKEEITRIVAAAETVVWIQNDYAIDMNPKAVFEKKPPIIWTTVPAAKRGPADCYVNWNQLTYREKRTPAEGRRDGLLYYGAPRKGRAKYFDKYFATDKYPVYILTSKKNTAAFARFTNALVTSSARLITDVLPRFKATLYIEDEASHAEYMSPANRFYEALGAGTAILFDASTCGTFEKAGIDISGYVVDGPDDVARLLGVAEDIAREQRRKWHKDFVADLCEQVIAAAKILDQSINGKGTT